MTNKKANKTQKTVKATTQNNNLTNVASVISYVQTLNNKNVYTQKVSGYVALKYANKTILELHDKKRSLEHITFSNKNNCFKLAQQQNIVTRIVADSYGWRLNTEVILTADAQKYLKAIVDSLIEEYETAFNAKNNKQQIKQA